MADGKESYASQSVPAVLMMIFQYSVDMGNLSATFTLLIFQLILGPSYYY